MKAVLAALAILAASLALRSAFPLYAVANAVHDDALFVRLATSIAAGHWLGPYDNLTHAKGAGYPLFIALVSLAGVPLKLAEHVAYLSGCAALSFVAARLLRSRAAGLACLAFLAFNPVLWHPEAGGRVIREGLYSALTLWIMALAAHAFLESRARRGALAALGVIGGFFWLTREEGLWLAPSVLLLALAWVVRSRGEPWRARVARLGIPVAAFSMVVAAMNLANYWRYGEFRNNDFRSRDFQQAYGALSRIAHEAPQPYVVFPADARRKAYAASPAARELAPVLDGPVGEGYRAEGCRHTAASPCREILAAWFVWALRDAVAGAGHYATPTRARAYYRTLAREVNTACERGELRCGPRTDSLIPSWQPDYGPRIAAESWRLLVSLATLGNMTVGLMPSAGSDADLEAFARITREPQSGRGDWMRVDPGLMTVAEGLARAQSWLMPWLLSGAFVGSLALAALAVRRRRWHPGLTLVGAFWFAVAMRVGLLGFLAATSMPVNAMLYLSPVVPLALVLAPFVLFLAVDMNREAA